LKKDSPKRRVLIVGEGRETEYNYFVGFRNAFEEQLEATSTSISVKRGKGGNAQNIVENAIKEAKRFHPNRIRGDRVFLLLDTEGPGRAPELPGAALLAKKHGIEIIYSCPAFEYWLLCHFDKISRSYCKDCSAVITKLNRRWNDVCKSDYDKADKDVFDRLSVQLDRARDQALTIDLSHLTLHATALCVNPSTQVYELIAILIGARTGKKCPITGKWKLIGDGSVTIQLSKGVDMPSHSHNSANWQC
jgi:RloB-like protein